MKRIMKSFWLIILMLFAGSSAYAAGEAADSAKVEEGFDMLGLINGHISDSHSWPVFGYENAQGEEEEFVIPLPVIAYYNGDVLITTSSSFDEGAEYVHNGYVYQMVDDKLMVRGMSGELEKVLDLSITRNVMSMFMCIAILLILFVGAARSYKKSEVPRGRTSLVEMLVLFVKDISDDQIGKERSYKYTPYLLTIFYFIWFNNLIGLVPFFPGSSNLSGNIAFTGTLAIITFIITNVSGSKHYWKHNFTVPGVPVILKFIMVPIEIISMFTKPFTLLIRLFANVTGGHIIILSLISMIFMMQSYVMAVPSVLLALFVFGLELILGALQAYIFTVLSALYIGLATEDED
ncbi:MAG: F0F1 ATP synthase subunit A [Bacteroidales bacterium]|nr:F0F1 ATP synthase subunit A [Bacteroidales bacterium]